MAKVIERVFLRLRLVYGPRWTSHATPDILDDLEKLWSGELAGLSVDHVARGVVRLREHPDWPPTPYRFRELCLPTDAELGYLPVEEAYRLAAGAAPRGNVMPAIVWAAQQEVGPHELRTLPEHRTFPRFKTIYERMIESEKAGKETYAYPDPPDPARQLEGQTREPKPKTEAGRQGLAAAKESVAKFRRGVAKSEKDTGEDPAPYIAKPPELSEKDQILAEDQARLTISDAAEARRTGNGRVGMRHFSGFVAGGASHE